MFNYIRKNSGGIISIFIIGAIALVFIFWGIGGQDQGTVEDIRINGVPVSYFSYSQYLNSISDNLRDQKAGQPLTDDEILFARRQALISLIDRRNLLTLSQSMGQTISAERINQEVKTNPIFQVDGRFSLETYEDLVPRYYNQSLANFEANLAEDLLITDTTNLIRNLSFVPVETVLGDYHFNNDILTLDYAFLPDSAFEVDQEPTEEQILAFYNENLEMWRVPAKASLEYVEVDIDDYKADVKVTEEDLATAYADERDSLSTPEAAVANQILVSFPSLSPTDEEKADAEKKAQDILARSKNEDFAALAKEFNPDTSSENGGAMGTVRRGQNLPEVEELIFGEGKNKLGEVVGPVSSIFGYHLVKVDSYQPVRQPTLEEATVELTEIVTQRQARRLAVDKIEDLLDILPTGNLTAKAFAETAKSVGLEPQETTLFADASDAPPFLAEDEDLVNAALSIPVGQAGDPVENPEHIILYTPLEKIESFIPTIEDEAVRPQVVTAWKASESKKLNLEAAVAFINSSEGLNWEEMIAKLPEEADVGTTSPFARTRFYNAGAYIDKTEPISFMSEFFKLSSLGDVTEAPIRVEGDNQGYVILAVSDITPIDTSNISQAELKNLQSTTKEAFATLALNWWASNIRSEAKVQLPQGLQSMLDGGDLTTTTGSGAL
jgi:peptidyl-prolyl cis-trans isomerase D